jgi:hypothetical protein
MFSNPIGSRVIKGREMGLATGKMYLFIERVPLRTHHTIRKEMNQGRKVLYLSKNSPNLLRAQLDFEPDIVQMKWLNPRPNDECIPPMNLEEFESKINQFLSLNKDGIVVLNGVEILEMWNGFRPVLDKLKSIQEKVSMNGNNFVISIDPKIQLTDHIKDLEKISDEVISSYA